MTKLFLSTGLILLITGMLFGIVGGLQYILPGFLKTYLSFEKTRPLHVSSVVFWILLAAMGGVLHYTREYIGRNLFSTKLLRLQWAVFVVTVLLVLASYLAGSFGGREYWEFPPLLAVPILLGWGLFAINYIKSIKSWRKQPVYVWMWLTGAIGFLLIFSESYLWLLPYFQQDVVRDMTVQWKSYGSLVGCWNMLVYGLGIYLMEKISKDKSYGHSKIGFSLYFLGLFNLFFNWSHHVYLLPVSGSIKHIGYVVSMTELLILGRIIYKWKGTVTQAQKFDHLVPYRFLWAADVWILVNLFLAIAMSVPAINVYTHGTHITVAHVMGTTIGINTMLLMAVCFDVLGENLQFGKRHQRQVANGYLIVNGSLFVFFMALVGAGIQRSVWQMDPQAGPFGEMVKGLVPYFVVFTLAGIFIFTGFALIVYPLLKPFALSNSYPDKGVASRKPLNGVRKPIKNSMAEPMQLE
ncbi:MAG TPA: cbb3-type cytochrome c oxidase subunit I [Cyclobacteriaceae bacterium]|nr:cbb3-type cytochrome c oxidase subunit I [Cyclobacteriaceae bacterium]MCB0499772.1 cbb3-type cytochrome c oxidase subunit I [Cyclobacteriaceae bacterium]MCB9238580.1 cbb3-type cytochrome c oxidase subunit I [Flammeovirgaceae bacterium]MCW5902371.1 cbb3-type cytochrome c oxidase subunit I [Cyclobacteriaceae bacterium]HOO08676.1 cbb3-type cytochrome c oxidase subunit I [Cyclobacteriaceae bacterium]